MKANSAIPPAKKKFENAPLQLKIILVLDPGLTPWLVTGQKIDVAGPRGIFLILKSTWHIHISFF
jgi:hypothetical protein